MGSVTMSRIGFVTYPEAPDITSDDRLAIAPLAALGYQVEPVIWRDARVGWQDYSAVVLRSCWDYHLDPGAFGAWIERMERDAIPLWNPARLVRWNMEKSYLRHLGVAIPPTTWLPRNADANLAVILDREGWKEAVVKPTISASATSTWTTSPVQAVKQEAEFQRLLGLGDVMVQRFEPAVVNRGEWSLLFFRGSYSHAVIKRAATGDFRVQSQHGGTSVSADPSPAVIEGAERALERVPGEWLYARVDLVEAEEGVLLMELEMVEPQLFLEYHPAAPARFAAAIAASIQAGARSRPENMSQRG